MSFNARHNIIVVRHYSAFHRMLRPYFIQNRIAADRRYMIKITVPFTYHGFPYKELGCIVQRKAVRVRLVLGAPVY